MAKYQWPEQGKASVLGSEVDRLDGVAKATGAAKYAYDVVADKMVHARLLGAPHAHCRIKKIDVSAAAKVPGVLKAAAIKEPGTEITWEGTPIAVVAGLTEGAVAEGLAAIQVDYEPLDIFNDDEDVEAAKAAGRTGSGGGNVQLENEPGDDDDEDEFAEKEINRLLGESAAVVEGYYGIQVITHCCLETHGTTCQWDGDKLLADLSTQNVSGTAGQFATPLNITADDVTVHCDYIGGGFGCKFAADDWGVLSAQLAKELGRPVKLMLDRKLEQKNAGTRPSGFLKVKVGADKNGVVKVWDSHHWGTSGIGGGGVSQGVVPYVFDPKNRRRVATTIAVNAAPARAWRAPNHPQGCAITQTAYDDIAAALKLDSFDVFMANLPSVSNGKAAVYAEQMKVAAKLMDWKAKWHPHGQGKANGSVVDGLGLAIHTWGGGAHNSNCLLKIHPDGGVETFLGSQDIGTGTRTVIAMVVAETLGLKPGAVKVNIGSSRYPVSGPSGGSTTVGGVSESNRRAAEDALDKILALAAGKLGVKAEELEAKDGRIQVRGNADKSLSWQQACSLLGMNPLEVRGEFQRGMDTKLSSSGVAGVQMAHVSVDKETGVVRVNKLVAVQDMGLIVNRKLAKSQIYGACIMGIAYALFEERILDRANQGAFLNAGLADYKLPRLGDVGDIVIELYEPDAEYSRGIVGLGEPPVIAPGAAISNAVCNALGVRVPVLPMTPQRVLEALQKARKAS